MIPDTPYAGLSEPPDYPWDIAAITTKANQTLYDCELVVNKYIDQIHDLVMGCVTSCGQTWAQCESCIEGKINERLTKADTIASKCSNKIMDRAQILFNQAESRVYDVTGKIPEMRDIVAEEMTRPASPPVDMVGQFQPLPRPASPVLPPQIFRPHPPPVFPSPPMTTPEERPDKPLPPGPPFVCPPGFVLSTNINTNEQQCIPHPAIPKPEPSPFECSVTPPTCPPGFQPQINAEGTAWECVPIPIPEPPCPPPSVACPAGQEWVWDGLTYRCQLVKPPKPSPPKPPAGGKPASWTDYLGLTDWNHLICPDTDQPANPEQIDEYHDAWNQYVEWLTGGILESVGFNKSDTFYGFVKGLFDIVVGPAKFGIMHLGNWLIDIIIKRRDCDYGLLIGPAIARAVLSLMEQWLDLGLDDLATNINYTISRACPTLLPSQPSIDQAYLADRISKDTWTCWTRANNNLNIPAFENVVASRQQPNILQWITARMREYITEDELQSKLRGSGVLDAAEGSILVKLMEQLPGPSDIIRFMLRDVEDTTIIDRYKLDTEFTDKFKGRSRFWAKAQGLPDDLMLRYWRAHWDWPSNTQLYTMLHRLREDSLDPATRKIAITIDDVRNVMSVNDVIPIWRDRLAAISYFVPHLSTAFDFFYYGRWDEKQLLDFYQNYGYNKQVADDHVSLAIKNKRLRQASKAAFITKRYLKEAYVSGAIGKQEARLGLDMLLLTNEQAEEAMQHLDYLRIVARRKDAMSAIKCRFKACEITKDTAVSLLVAAGWQLEDAIDDVTCWKQQCEIKGKEATAAQLCTWWGMGLLTDNEYRLRLRRLGYSEDDTRRIMTKCASDLEKKQSKEKKGSAKNGQPTA